MKIKNPAAPLLCGLRVFILFKLVFFLGYVPSVSMEPAIRAESLVLGFRVFGEIGCGDVLVFERDGRFLVKRVVGAPGDILYISQDGLAVSVNTEMPDADRILTVPDDCFFVMGDNREHSIDSRVWEDPFVRRAQVVARVAGCAAK